MTDQPITYASAGVDVEAGDRAVDLMKESVKRAQRPEVLGGLGGFAGMFDASALMGMERPVLATSTDGVGTKVAIAQAMGVHDTIGIDLVGMVVDDIVVCGAEPLFMTDYIACGKVVPERIAAVVQGIARGCHLAGVALVGGETAEHPGLLDPDEYDVAGAATGVVEYDKVLGPQRVRAGDAVIALASSGLHSNGYSLVRRVIAAQGLSWDAEIPEFGRTLGEEALVPTRIYTKMLLDMIATDGIDIHALSHVTGGGLAANLARVLPAGLTATVERETWTPPAVFSSVQQWGQVPREDLERTLNMGVGFVAVLPAEQADAGVRRSEVLGVPAWVLGEVSDGAPGMADGEDVVQGAKGVDGGSVRMVGDYAS
ncbi:phosphoribosylformylglycinamidine cyclo-ligase [Ornithinimicrobium sp. Arc0846-15]|nr:phosphoribosylformylglycinamidine cyclo-ligase [Ornithinimicrobium laminariae]